MRTPLSIKWLLFRKKPTRLRIPYDPAWKDVTEVFLLEFLKMFFPDLYEQLDLDFTPRFVEKEVRSQIKGRAAQFVDKLILVRLVGGEMRLVLVHIEFESHPRNVPKRMFDYYCLLKDLEIATLFPDLVPAPIKGGRKHAATPERRSRKKLSDLAITSLVVYVGNNVPKIPDRYEVNDFGTSVVFRFNSYIVRDQNEADLEANPNPLALVILATKYVNQTFDDDTQRLTLKEKAYQLATQRGLHQNQADALLLFIDEMMRLSPPLHRQFNIDISNPSFHTPMRYASQVSLDLADAITKVNYGYTYAELEMMLKQTVSEQESVITEKETLLTEKDSLLTEKESLLTEKESLLTEKDSLLTEKDSVIMKGIVRLHSERQMSVEEIADLLGLPAAFVTDTLAKNK